MNEGRQLLDLLARSLGYTTSMLMTGSWRSIDSSGSARCVYECIDAYACFRRRSEHGYCFGTTPLKDGEGSLMVADFVFLSDEDGVAMAYKFFAEKAYKTLVSGRSLDADGKKFKAEDVPEFMMKCVLNGIA